MRALVSFLLLGAIAFVVFTAVGVGGDDKDTAAAAAPTPTPARHLTARQRYSENLGLREAGGGSKVLEESIPFQPKAFDGPVAAYKRYALARATALRALVARLRAALAAGDRGRAQAAWREAFAEYLRLGAVYGQFATLDRAIDGPDDGAARFTGLHRIERGLWNGERLTELRPFAAQLAANVLRLPRTIRREPIDALDYATRSHEILEDAQRDYLSRVDVPWSGEGVIATAAGLSATREVVHTLTPLLRGTDTRETVDLGLDRLGSELRTIRTAHGRLPSLDALAPREREQLDGALSFALERLQELPASLETADLPPIPKLP